jgi:hypothetical protein
MGLFTQQRILCNGLAQRDYDEVWPALARGRGRHRDRAGAPGQPQAHRAARADRGGSRSTRAARSWCSVSGDACSSSRTGRSATLLATTGLRAAFFTGQEAQRRRTQNLVDFHDDPRDARVVRHRRGRRRPQPAEGRELHHQPRPAVEPRGARAAHRPSPSLRPDPAGRCLRPGRRRRHRGPASPPWSPTRRRCSAGYSTATATPSTSPTPAPSCRGSRR